MLFLTKRLVKSFTRPGIAGPFTFMKPHQTYVHTTRHGSTQKVAQMIKEGLNNEEKTLINLSNSKKADLKLFEKSIIGRISLKSITNFRIRTWTFAWKNHWDYFFTACMKKKQYRGLNRPFRLP